MGTTAIRKTHRRGLARIRTALAWIEEGVYVIVGILLLVAGAFIVVGTLSELIRAIRHDLGAVDIGVLLLDRILLTLIVAELLHTLRFVVLRGKIVVEPFLFVGLDRRRAANPDRHRRVRGPRAERACAHQPTARARPARLPGNLAGDGDLPGQTQRTARLRSRPP